MTTKEPETMTFEQFDKLFPELKDKKYLPNIYESCECCGPECHWEISKNGYWINITDMNQLCLSKQRVKEAMGQIIFSIQYIEHDVEKLKKYKQKIDAIIKELELDDDKIN